MSEGRNDNRGRDVGLYLDDGGNPAGVRLFSTGAVDERLCTDALGQFHFTRWRRFSDVGWKVDFSFTLSAQATRGLVNFIRAFSTVEQQPEKKEPAIHSTTTESLGVGKPDPEKK